MQLPELATAGLEQALNSLLALDPDIQARLSHLHGKRVAIHLLGVELTLVFVPDDCGRLQVYTGTDIPADATISGTPIGLMRANDTRQGSAQLFAGEMQLEGDTDLAHRFSNILKSLDIDWEELLSRIIGDMGAHKLGLEFRNIRSRIDRNIGVVEQNLGEYLTEETRLLPARPEIDDLLTGIDQLRDDVERLAARIQLLQKARKRTS